MRDTSYGSDSAALNTTRKPSSEEGHPMHGSKFELRESVQSLNADDRNSARHIVVGVTPRQPGRVLEVTLRWASSGFIDYLHFVYVDPTLVAVDDHLEPLDSDSLDESAHTQASMLSERIMRAARDAGVRATFRAVGGDPATGLSDQAQRTGSSAIVVGTRERGSMAAIGEWIRGSVSVRLEHMQALPVIVIPLKDYADINSDRQMSSEIGFDDGDFTQHGLTSDNTKDRIVGDDGIADDASDRKDVSDDDKRGGAWR